MLEKLFYTRIYLFGVHANTGVACLSETTKPLPIDLHLKSSPFVFSDTDVYTCKEQYKRDSLTPVKLCLHQYAGSHPRVMIKPNIKLNVK